MRAPDLAILTAALVLIAAAPAAARQKPGAAKPAAATAEPDLKYEREFYLYPASRRRDPFMSLAARSDIGPRFDELELQGIIYSTPGRSVALLGDPAGRIYRVRRGDTVGNARVIEIRPMRVLFAVEDFGVVRQDQLEMERKAIGGVKG